MLKNKTSVNKLLCDAVLQHVMAGCEPLHLPGSGNVFNELVKNIIYQQISIKAADRIFERFESLLHKNYTPDTLLKFSADQFRHIGLSHNKASYVLNIAEFFKEHQLYDQDWSLLPDEAVIDLLSKIKGVGSWTAKMILIFELERSDILPFEDLAIRLTMQEL
jgi:DNA-3-methyladenine glycosylase II